MWKVILTRQEEYASKKKELVVKIEKEARQRQEREAKLLDDVLDHTGVTNPNPNTP